MGRSWRRLQIGLFVWRRQDAAAAAAAVASYSCSPARVCLRSRAPASGPPSPEATGPGGETGKRPIGALVAARMPNLINQTARARARFLTRADLIDLFA